MLPLRPGGRSYLFSKFPFFIYRNIIPYTLQFFFCQCLTPGHYLGFGVFRWNSVKLGRAHLSSSWGPPAECENSSEVGTSFIFVPGTRGTRIITNLSTFTKKETAVVGPKRSHGTQHFLKLRLKLHIFTAELCHGKGGCKLAPQAHGTLLFSFAMLHASFANSCARMRDRTSSLP